MNCQRERLLVFLLANSWVGQNFGSIKLYFLFYFRMDCDWIVGSPEAKNRRKRPGKIHQARSIGASVRSIGQ